MDGDLPEALQIEVTNRCNFNCQMCIRRVWNAKPLDLNLNLYRKIAESSFSRLNRLILYGLGEPFVNPNFPEMLRIARKHLPKESTKTQFREYTKNGKHAFALKLEKGKGYIKRLRIGVTWTFGATL